MLLWRGLLRRDALYVLMLALFSGLFFWPLLSLKYAWYQEDFAPLAMPYLHWLHGKFSAGLPPLWSGGVLCGYPYFNEGVTGAFYEPMRWLLGSLDYAAALLAHGVLHVFVGAAGLYALGRHKGLRAEASLLAAMVGGFSGAVIYSTSSWVLLCSLAWFPWMLLGASLSLVPQRRMAGAALLGLAMGASLLGGHLGFAAYECLGLAAVAAFGLARGGRRQLLASSGALALAALLSGLLAGGQLAATLHYSAQSIRSQAFSYAMASENSLSPASLVHLLLPYAFGDGNDGSFLGHSWPLGTWLPQGMLCYLGAASLALAALGFWRRPDFCRPFALASLALTAYALGSWFFVHRLFYHLPLFGHLRAPMRAVMLVPALLALPAAAGFECLEDEPGLAWRLFRWLGAWALACLAAAALIRLGSPWALKRGEAFIQARILGHGAHAADAPYYFAKLSRWIGGLQAHLCWEAGLALAASLCFLWQFKRPSAARTAPLLALLLFAGYASYAARYQPLIERAYYDRPPETALQLRSLMGRSPLPRRFVSWGWADLLLKSFPLGRMGWDSAGEFKLREMLGGDAALFYGLENFQGYNTVGLAHVSGLMGGAVDFKADEPAAQMAAELLKARQALNEGSVRFIVASMPLKAPGLALRFDKPLFVYENSQALEMARLEDGSAPPQRWLRHDDEAWELELTMPRAGRLQLGRAFEKGGQLAWVDGVEAEALPSGSAWMALQVAPGKHLLKISPNPHSFEAAGRWHRAGLALAMALIMGSLGGNLGVRKQA